MAGKANGQGIKLLRFPIFGKSINEIKNFDPHKLQTRNLSQTTE